MLTQSQKRILIILGILDFIIICGISIVIITSSLNAFTADNAPAATLHPTATTALTNTPHPTPIPTATLRPVVAKALVLDAICDTEFEFSDTFHISEDSIALLLSFAKLTCAEEPGYLGIFVGVQDLTEIAISVNPQYFSVVDFQDQVFNIDAATFDLDSQFKAVTIPSEGLAMGFVIFDIGPNNPPRYLVYDDGQHQLLFIDLVEAIQRQAHYQK